MRTRFGLADLMILSIRRPEVLPKSANSFSTENIRGGNLINSKVISRPSGQMPYETAGDLILNFPDSASVEDYRRDLNLDTAVTTVEYSTGGTHFTRQIFASPVDQVIVVRLTADKKGSISFVAGFKTPQKATIETESGDTLVMRGINGDAQGVKGALKFQVRARVLADGGKVNVTSDSVAGDECGFCHDFDCGGNKLPKLPGRKWQSRVHSQNSNCCRDREDI